MMRSSCLSALLVGLSLTCASAALAAPPASKSASKTENQPVQRVALAQQSGEPAPSTGAPGSTAPGAGDGSSETAPAVTIGNGTPPPIADAPAQAAAEPTGKPKPRPFAGSSMTLMTSTTTNTIFRGQTQYANPTVESTLFLTPRYAINEAFQLRARLLVSYEYTNNDSTTYQHEPMLSDTNIQLFYRKIPKLPLGIQPAVALNAGLPTSKLSRARTLVFTPGATLQLAKGIEHFFGGEAMILGTITYSHPIYQSRNPEVSDPRPSTTLSCVGGGNCGDLLSGTLNPSDTLSYLLVFAPEWGHFSPGVAYLGGHQWVYSPKEVANPVDGSAIGRPDGFEPTSVRQSHYVSAWLDYNINSWLTGEVGFWNSVSAINGGGTRSNVIFDRYQETRVYLSGVVQLDNLVKAVQGAGEGEAGIVRAKSTKSPFRSF